MTGLRCGSIGSEKGRERRSRAANKGDCNVVCVVCWRSPCRSDEAEKRLRKAEPMKMADLVGWLCKKVWKSKWVMGGLSRIKWRRADGRKRADLGD